MNNLRDARLAMLMVIPLAQHLAEVERLTAEMMQRQGVSRPEQLTATSPRRRRLGGIAELNAGARSHPLVQTA